MTTLVALAKHFKVSPDTIDRLKKALKKRNRKNKFAVFAVLTTPIASIDRDAQVYGFAQEREARVLEQAHASARELIEEKFADVLDERRTLERIEDVCSTAIIELLERERSRREELADSSATRAPNWRSLESRSPTCANSPPLRPGTPTPTHANSPSLDRRWPSCAKASPQSSAALASARGAWCRCRPPVAALPRRLAAVGVVALRERLSAARQSVRQSAIALLDQPTWRRRTRHRGEALALVLRRRAATGLRLSDRRQRLARRRRGQASAVQVLRRSGQAGAEVERPSSTSYLKVIGGQAA